MPRKNAAIRRKVRPTTFELPDGAGVSTLHDHKRRRRPEPQGSGQTRARGETAPWRIAYALIRAAVNPLHPVPQNGLAIAQARFVNGRRRSLLLQPRVISRRRRHGRRRGTCRRHKGPAAEAQDRSSGKAWIKSFHILSPGAEAAHLRAAAFLNWPAMIAFSRHGLAARAFHGRIWSGVSLGEPLPLASALLISATTRRDSGTCSPWRSAISAISPCR